MVGIEPPPHEWVGNDGKPIYFDSIDNSAYILGKAGHSARRSWIYIDGETFQGMRADIRGDPAEPWVNIAWEYLYTVKNSWLGSEANLGAIGAIYNLTMAGGGRRQAAVWPQHGLRVRDHHPHRPHPTQSGAARAAVPGRAIRSRGKPNTPATLCPPIPPTSLAAWVVEMDKRELRMTHRFMMAVALLAGSVLSMGARAQSATPALRRRTPELRRPPFVRIKADEDATELAKKLQNPIGDLNSFPFQGNTDFDTGPHNGTQEILNVQPVIPIHITSR